MQAIIYQLTLVIGLGTLVILLLRGYGLQEALTRSALVLVAVLFILIIAGNVMRLSLRQRERDLEAEELPNETLIEGESEDGESG